ncbi:MAG: hypothetical protein PHV59_09930 [Victivallales bacterium]|nr:hypothetical protein [Victivallales bacterium]
MIKWLATILVFSALRLHAGVKIEEVYLENKFTGYLVESDFFSAVIFAPDKLNPIQVSPDALRGGWFRNLALKGSENLLAGGQAPDGKLRYGLVQVFEPVMELPEKQKEFILPGIGKSIVDDNGEIQIKEPFPWTAKISYSGKNKENAEISFSQDCDGKGQKLNYKMRIDCTFTDSAIMEIHGVFLNLDTKTFTGRISPAAIFNNSDETAPWIAIPYQRARKLKTGRITYIDSTPLPVSRLSDYYEFSQDRLSKVKRWLAVGGLKQKGMLVFLSEANPEKAVFWKSGNCFSAFPCVKLEAKPQERVEWSWKIIIGRGLDAIDSVTEKGILGINLSKPGQGKHRRYKCTIQFLPVAKSKDLIMDILLKSARGMILDVKSYEMFDSSPLKPESIIMKLPGRVQPDARYLLKVELMKDGNIFMHSDHWLFPE